MNQEPVPSAHSQRQASLGEQVRKIADQLKQETNLQIKATSRILGAAAQIAENQDRLIHEVVEMAEDDLAQPPQMFLTNAHTVDTLKQQFGTLSKAKAHFGLKAASWAALVDKLNPPSAQNSTPAQPVRPLASDERLETIEHELRLIRAELSQVLSLLKQLTLDQP